MVIVYVILFSLLGVCNLSAQIQKTELKFIETSDVHGNYLSYDYIEQCEREGSLARVQTYVLQEREKYRENLFLFDNGDVLEGQPISYYYNYIDTVSTHVCVDIMNYMRYDICNMGNHDVEVGVKVLKRFVKSCDFHVLSANTIHKNNENIYSQPYVVFEREGLRIAVIGMITPAVPAWLSKDLWEGMTFDDMESSARFWMDHLQREEKPDIIIGLFHSGSEARILADKYKEDASVEIAQRIPGFDFLMIGHDHRLFCEKIVNVNGDSVLVVNPAAGGFAVADVTLTVTRENGVITDKQIEGKLVDVSTLPSDPALMARYKPQHEKVNEFALQKLGMITETITTRPAYFGSSAFVDFIHTVQLDITGADISFASPLSFDARIECGDIRVCDLFNLYRYKNLIYTMQLSGNEIKNYLEASYGIWTNQMISPDDHLLLFDDKGEEEEEIKKFANQYFYFDSAAGIIYTVDVTKPFGEKIHIIRMSDGRTFDENEMYTVAVTSYRGNGGGELLTKGAGLAIDELEGRILKISDKDFRYYLIDYIYEHKVIYPQALNHWEFIPEDWVKCATKRDYRYLFGKDN